VRAADLGAGSGAVSVLLAGRLPQARLTAIEISTRPCAVLQRNFIMNQLDSRCTAMLGDVRDQTLLPRASLDLVVSNPPYRDPGRHLSPARLPDDPALAQEWRIAVETTTLSLDDLMHSAAYWLKPGGLIALVQRPVNLPDILTAMRQTRIEPVACARSSLCPVERRPACWSQAACMAARDPFACCQTSASMNLPASPARKRAKSMEKKPMMQTTSESASTLPRGTLILVGTPIGNLGDLSRRVIEVLAQVDLIAAEDTRRTRQLLSYLGLHQPLTSYHEHNQAGKGQELIEKLRSGQSIALVSDAGMPCISDPALVWSPNVWRPICLCW